MSIQPIAWECECGGIVPVENIACSGCGALRPYGQLSRDAQVASERRCSVLIAGRALAGDGWLRCAFTRDHRTPHKFTAPDATLRWWPVELGDPPAWEDAIMTPATDPHVLLHECLHRIFELGNDAPMTQEQEEAIVTRIANALYNMGWRWHRCYEVLAQQHSLGVLTPESCSGSNGASGASPVPVSGQEPA